MKDNLKAAASALREAEQNLGGATHEVANFDSIQLTKVRERDEVQGVYEISFGKLKAFDWANPRDQRKYEQKHVASLMAMLEKLNADASMVSAVPSAMKKSPDERGDFDIMVVNEVDAKLRGQLSELEERLSKGDALKDEMVQAEAAAKDALEAAHGEQARRAESVRVGEAALCELEASERASQVSVNEQEDAISDARSHYASEEYGLEKAQEAMITFDFLKERVAAEPPAEESPDEAAPEEAGAEEVAASADAASADAA